MKNKFLILLAFVATVGSVVFFDSCTPDPVGTLGPSTSLVSGADVVTTSAVIPANGSFAVNITATSGDVEMNSLTVKKDGNTVDFANLTINGAAASSNPVLLFGADRTALDYTIGIQTDLQAGESANYTIEITDDNGNTSTESVSISVDAQMDPPTLTLSGSGNSLTVHPATSFKISFTAAKGTADLALVGVLEDGVPVDVSRITSIDNGSGSVAINANPVAVPSSDVGGFSWDMFVRASDMEKTAIYSIILTDANGLSDTITQEIVTEVPGTALDSIKTMLRLYNQGGPSGTGGVNLKTGESLGSADANAHLRDGGLDLNKPAATNWRQLIGPGAATATLKKIDIDNQVEGFSYGSVDTKEAVRAAFDAETNVIPAGAFSDVIQEGDMFVLETTLGEYMLVRIDDIVITTGEGDNSDHYVLSVKF